VILVTFDQGCEGMKARDDDSERRATRSKGYVPSPGGQGHARVARGAAATVLALQSGAGNGAVARALLQRSVGTVGRGLGKAPITVYEWNGGGFTPTTNTIARGSELAEARRTMQDAKFAFVRTEDPAAVQAGPKTMIQSWQQGLGFVRVSDIRVQRLGAPYDATADYADAHRLLNVTGNRHERDRYDPSFEQWYLDQAVLMEAYHELDARALELQAEGEDTKQLEDTKRRLALAMTQSFAKGAELQTGATPHEVPLGMQASPIFQQGRYHRSAEGGSQALSELRVAIAGKAGLSGEQIEPIGDAHFGEVLHREMPVYSVRDTTAKPNKKVNTVIASVSDFRRAVRALLANLKAGIAPTHTFVLDASLLYVAASATPKELQAKVAMPLQNALLEEADEHVSNTKKRRRKATSKQVAAAILNRLQLVVFTEHDGVRLVLIPKLLEGLGKPDAFGSRDVRKYVDEAERKHFRTRKAHAPGTLTTAIVESGARLDPSATRQALLGQMPTAELLKRGRAVEVELATAGAWARAVTGEGGSAEERLVAAHKARMDLAGFLGTNVYKSFRGLSTKGLAGGKPAPAYLRFYPEATCGLLDGLADVKGPLGGVDKTFAKRGITQVLQAVYVRALGAMAKAITVAGEMPRFMDCIETIHDQLQLILGIVEPHSQGTAFAKGIVGALREPFKDPSVKRDRARPTLPDDLDASVQHKASSMHSLASIISGVEAQAAAGGRTSLSMLVLKDNYYESAGAAEHSRAHLVSVLDGYKVGHDPMKAEHFEGGQPPPAPVDIFICDFHHNISVERNEYQLENVVHQVDELFRLGLVADRFTVAIDCTVDFLRSRDVRAFLEHFKDRIDRGELNVVLYRSAQKFDMLGMDNYYGGYTITINNARAYAQFDTRMKAADDQVTGLAHQGLAHLAQFGSKAGDDYRRALIENTAALYRKLMAKGLGDQKGPLCIGQTSDPNNFFLDIQFPETEALPDNASPNPGNSFIDYFRRWAPTAGVALTERPSFGFATTNLTTIAGSKTRLNPGLEDDTALDRYADFFASCKQRMLTPRAHAHDDISAIAGPPWPHPDDTSREMALARAIAVRYERMFKGDRPGPLPARAVESAELPEPEMIAHPREGGSQPLTLPAPRRRARPAVSPAAPADVLPARKDLEIAPSLQPNPYLWCCANSANDYNWAIADHRPGRGWWYIEQFCCALAIHWLQNGATRGKLRFVDLNTSARDTAVALVKRWGGVGVDQQAEDARQAIGGEFVSRDKVVDNVAAKRYVAGTRMWFGTSRHSEGAVRTEGGRWRVYDPNVGTTRSVGATDFSAYLRTQGTFAVSRASASTPSAEATEVSRD